MLEVRIVHFYSSFCAGLQILWKSEILLTLFRKCVIIKSVKKRGLHRRTASTHLRTGQARLSPLVDLIIDQTARFVNRRNQIFIGKERKFYMCKECKRQLCPPSCPGFEHILAGRGKAENHCQLCGGAIYPGEEYYRRGETAVCSDCEKFITASELRTLTGREDLLIPCGFEKVC